VDLPVVLYSSDLPSHFILAEHTKNNIRIGKTCRNSGTCPPFMCPGICPFERPYIGTRRYLQEAEVNLTQGVLVRFLKLSVRAQCPFFDVRDLDLLPDSCPVAFQWPVCSTNSGCSAKSLCSKYRSAKSLCSKTIACSKYHG